MLLRSGSSLTSIFLYTLFFGQCCSVSKAEVILDIPNVSIAADGMGFIDVLITTDGGDNLFAADYEFEVGVISGGSALDITSIEGGVLGNVFGDYVFAGTDHFGQEVDFSTPLPGSTFIGSDALDLDLAVSPNGALLTRINFLHTSGFGGASAADGDMFSLSLLDDGDTFFEGDAGELNISTSSFMPATITITAAAVPEPSTFGLLACCLGTMLVMRSRKRVADNPVSDG